METELQEAIANEVEKQVYDALAAIPDIVEESVEQVFRAANANAQGRICVVVYDAMQSVIFDQT